MSCCFWPDFTCFKPKTKLFSLPCVLLCYFLCVSLFIYLFFGSVRLVSCFGHLANGSPMIFNAIYKAKIRKRGNITTCTYTGTDTDPFERLWQPFLSGWPMEVGRWVGFPFPLPLPLQALCSPSPESGCVCVTLFNAINAN